MGSDYPTWKERFGSETLKDIRSSQGPYMYATQYLNMPRDPADALFQRDWLQIYNSFDEIPKPYTTATIVDLALWGDTKGIAKNVVITIARDYNNHLWLMRYDRGKYNPTELIEIIERHTKQFDSTVHIEEVYYQKAVRHFAKVRMEQTGYAYTMNKLKSDNSKNAKANRIRTIQAHASNGFIHIKPMMAAFIDEYCDYPGGITCDILDCLGFATQRKIPSRPTQIEIKKTESPFSLDVILGELVDKSSNAGYPFSLQCGKKVS